MTLIFKPLSLLALLLLNGCASTLTAIFERAVSTENFREDEQITSVLTMTGERRTVVAMPRNSNRFVCAEALPDVARAAAARSILDLQGSAASGVSAQRLSAEDEVATALLATFARTETADVVRQLGWQLCQAYINGGITSRDYAGRLQDLVVQSFAALRARPVAVLQARDTAVQGQVGQARPRPNAEARPAAPPAAAVPATPPAAGGATPIQPR